MTAPSPSPSGFAIDPARPLPGAGGGVPAFAAEDRRAVGSALMALLVAPGLPARARAIATLAGHPLEGVLAPLGHGSGPAPPGGQVGEALYVICRAPPGPALAAEPARRWSEAALIEQVLRPAAHALAGLAALGVTHRAIRRDNVFRAGPGQPITLGAAWAAPPALHQDAMAEPPYVAMCLPAGRGEGSIADDVYALGALLLGLVLGPQSPTPGSPTPGSPTPGSPTPGSPTPGSPDPEPAATIRRKLELGSFEAMAGAGRIPPLLADLLRGMLAEDPEHRPPPALLADPDAARARRLAARPPRRAQRRLRIAGAAAGDAQVGDARNLAFTLANAPEAGWRALRSGAIDTWLRRELGDATLAMRLEETLRLRAVEAAPGAGAGEATLLSRAVAVLDPLAPLTWQGVALWPDGMGGALAEAAREDGAGPRLRALGGLIEADEVAPWGELRAAREDHASRRADARLWRGWLALSGPAGGMRRLIYELNPLLPCASPILGGRIVTGLAALPAALEAQAPSGGEGGPLDAELLAFIAARQEHRGTIMPDGLGPMQQMETLARLQARFHPAPLPALARWLARAAAPLAAQWHHRARREAIGRELAARAEAGLIGPLAALLRDPAEREADTRGLTQARAELARLDAELAALAAGGAGRAALARRWGQEMAAGIGIAALAAVLGLAALG